MAYGYKCKHCGNQEAHHLAQFSSQEEYHGHVRGYRFSVLMCPGFEYAKKDHAALLHDCRDDPTGPVPDFIEEIMDNQVDHLALEQQGAARGAWGQYASHCFEVNEQHSLQKLDKAITEARDTAERSRAIQKKQDFEKFARIAPMYIG